MSLSQPHPRTTVTSALGDDPFDIWAFLAHREFDVAKSVDLTLQHAGPRGRPRAPHLVVWAEPGPHRHCRARHFPWLPKDQCQEPGTFPFLPGEHKQPEAAKQSGQRAAQGPACLPFLSAACMWGPPASIAPSKSPCPHTQLWDEQHVLPGPCPEHSLYRVAPSWARSLHP